LGLDSLERMEIVNLLEETYGGHFPEEVLPTIETVREVAAAVETYLGRRPRQLDQPTADREIPPEHYRIDQFPQYQKLVQQMHAAAAAGLANPYFKVHESVISDTTVVEGRELISFSSYNYLGMSGDPAVTAAAKRAIDQ